jgi:protein-glutamine gamma-glutamyltransferase
MSASIGIVERAMTRWPGWQHLPREARDTLFLLAVIGWTALPHLLHLPLWCAGMCTVVILWRAKLALGSSPLPGKWLLCSVLLLALGLTQWSFHTLMGKQAGVTLLLVLMALKTLELRAQRDAFVVFFLGFFLVLTHFLYSQSLAVAAAMLISVWGLLTATVLAHMPAGIPSLRQAARLSLRCAALGLPMMVLLFVFFPRIAPLWGVPQDKQGSTGLSNSMSMGSVAQVVQDERVAMRLKFLALMPPPNALYFRGPVLSRFDGNEWTPAAANSNHPAGKTTLQTQGEGVRYEATLEPTRLAVVPTLEATAELPHIEGLATWRQDDLVWATQRPVTERLRFIATAYPRFSHGPLQADAPELAAHLQLPAGFNPKLIHWARSLANTPQYQHADASQLAQAVMAHIHTGGFGYTLAPGLYGETNPQGALDEFWFERRLGFCEHFSASFVVTMRAMNIPARVVTGYQGIDPEMQDGYHLVRQSAAHAWAEYWLLGTGWVRADPTAAVAPERIELGRRLVGRPSAVANAINAVNPIVLTRLRGLWETMDNRWNQWVLQYAQGEQRKLLEKWGFTAPTWQDLVKLLALSLAALSLLGAGWGLLDHHRQDQWQRQSKALRKALQTLGLQALPYQAPRALASQVLSRFGPTGTRLVDLLLELERQRYGPLAKSKPSRHWWAQLKVELLALKKSE